LKIVFKDIKLVLIAALCLKKKIKLNSNIFNLILPKFCTFRRGLVVNLLFKLAIMTLVGGSTLVSNTDVIAQVDIEKNLRSCLTNKKMDFWIQPIVDVDGCIKAGEILARWNRGNEHLVTTEKLIEISERSELVHEIGFQSLDFAIKVLEKVKTKSPEVSLSINISPKQFVDKNFLQELESSLLGANITSSNLTLEISERGEIDDMEEFINSVSQFKRLGVRISLDDFGSRNSNIDRVLQLDVDEVKLDKSLTVGLFHNAKASFLVEALATFINNSGLSIVIEGVETKEQADWCRSCNCNGVIKQQGFYYSKAITFDEFLRKL